MPNEATQTATVQPTPGTATATPAPAAPVVAQTTAPTQGTATATPTPASAKAPDVAAAASAPAASTDTATPAAAPAVEQPKAEPAKPAVDEVAQSLGALNREIRAAKAEREKVKSDAAKMADKLALGEQHAKARDALKAKDYVTALKALDPELSVDEAILTLIDQAKALDAQPLSQADIERITVAKIEEQQRIAAENEAKAQTARVELATANYVAACAAEFNPETFPLIAALGVSKEKIQEFTEAAWQRDRSIPTPADTLKHFEAEFERKLKMRGYSKAEIAEAKAEAQAAAATPTQPAKPVATAPIADTKGAAAEPTKGKHETIKEYDARIKAQLRALKDQRGVSTTR